MRRHREPVDGMGVIVVIYTLAMVAIALWLAWLTVRGA